jgi:hypothetical protein
LAAFSDRWWHQCQRLWLACRRLLEQASQALATPMTTVASAEMAANGLQAVLEAVPDLGQTGGKLRSQTEQAIVALSNRFSGIYTVNRGGSRARPPT